MDQMSQDSLNGTFHWRDSTKAGRFTSSDTIQHPPTDNTHPIITPYSNLHGKTRKYE
jgi:hypothetical protein